MDIVSPEAIKFCDAAVRPFSEKLRALKAEADSIMADWNGGKNLLFPVDAAAIVQDGREKTGITLDPTGDNVAGAASGGSWTAYNGDRSRLRYFGYDLAYS